MIRKSPIADYYLKSQRSPPNYQTTFADFLSTIVGFVLHLMLLNQVSMTVLLIGFLQARAESRSFSSGIFKNCREFVRVKTGFTVQDPVGMQALVLRLILVGGADGAGAGTVGGAVAVVLP